MPEQEDQNTETETATEPQNSAPKPTANQLAKELQAMRQAELAEFNTKLATLLQEYGVELVPVTWQNGRGDCGGRVDIVDVGRAG